MVFRITNISDISCKKIETYILYPMILFSEKGAVYEITWKNTVQPDRPQMTTWRIARCIPKVTNPHSALSNTYCFSTATMVARTRLSLGLYLHCLSYYNIILYVKQKFCIASGSGPSIPLAKNSGTLVCYPTRVP
jgi:hypothetical protein